MNFERRRLPLEPIPARRLWAPTRRTSTGIGLYLNPPVHAAVFCVDEKSAIQALDRKDPVGANEHHFGLNIG
jgi:hypothetical protein